MLYLGRRKANGLTASDPGDTLYFPWGSYNDSGDSEATTGYVDADIEVFKDGGVAQRATDSGYTATTSFDSRTGLNVATVELYNTSNDPSFYAAGSSYMVAVDAVTIDGKTVRHWVGTFDIDHPTDTGLIQTLVATEVAKATNKMDTGVPPSVWANATRTLSANTNLNDITAADVRAAMDTGTLNSVTAGATAAQVRAAMDTGTLNSVAATDLTPVTNKLDTGVPLSVWTSGTRTLTASTNFNDITAAEVWAAGTRTLTANTNLNDITAAEVRAAMDTGTLNSVASTDLTPVTNKLDTGVPPSVWANATRTLSANTNLNDITAADVRAAMDTGTLNSVTAGDNTDVLNKLDTGVPASVWTNATRTLTAGTNLNDISAADVWASGTRTLTAFAFDTGVSDTVWKASLSAYTDTGSAGYKLDLADTGVKDHITEQAAPTVAQIWAGDTGIRDYVNDAHVATRTDIKSKVDTGVPASVWEAGTRTLSSFGFDTGVADTIWKSSGSTYVDTGSLGYKLDLLDTGVKGHIDSLSQKVDTGVPASVDAVVDQTDTGLRQYIDRTDTGLRAYIDNVDTGVHSVVAALSNKADTGVPAAVWEQSRSGFTDTGSFGWGVNVEAFGQDTGAVGLDGGKLSVSAPAAVVDTGTINDAVWQTAPGDGTRSLTESTAQDTGTAANVIRILAKMDTGDVNVGALRGDTGAAIQLTNMYNGTGYTDPTAPASRAQVDGIGASSGASLNYEATTDNTGGDIKGVSFTGVETSGTFASTEAEDGVYHQIDDTTNVIDIVYSHSVGGGRTAVSVTFKGYVAGLNDTVLIQVYDHVGTDWETIGTIAGQAGTDNITVDAPLLSKHTGTGADLGDVYIRYITDGGASNPTLYVDASLVAAVNIGQSVGYESGAVWVDTGSNNTNTESFVDGVADNPVSTIGAATTIAGQVGLSRFEVAPGSTFTLSAAANDYIILGHEYSISLGGQDITHTKFMNFKTITDSGIVSGGGTSYFEHGNIGGPFAVGQANFSNVAFLNDDTGFIANAAGNYEFYDCVSGVPGNSSPTFNFSGLGPSTNVSFRRWSGGINVTLDADVTMSIDGVSGGTVTVNGTGGAISIRGMFQGVTDNSGGSVSITNHAVINNRTITDAIWDEADTGHAVAGTFGGILQALDTGIPSAIDFSDTGVYQLINRFDTGINNRADQIHQKVDTGVPRSVWYESTSTYNDTGGFGYSLWEGIKSKLFEYDTGTRNAILQLQTKNDTGVPASVWEHATRTLSSFAFDTGVANAVWKESHSSYTDTGSFGWGVNVNYWKKDTGAVYVDPGSGWPCVNTEAIYSSEPAALDLREWANRMQNTGQVDTGGFAVEFFDRIRKAVDTGTFDVNVKSVDGDTGAAGHLRDMAEIHDTGLIDVDIAKIWGNQNAASRLSAFAQNVNDSGVIDTGAMIGLRFLYNKLDTGVPPSVRVAMDTGTLNSVTGGGGGSADTGAIAAAVWNYAYANAHDTGSMAAYITKIDTGSKAHTTARVNSAVSSLESTISGEHFLTLNFIRSKLDTGVPESVRVAMDTGTLNSVTAGGSADTGLIAAAVWGYALSQVADTGAAGSKLDTIDTGSIAANAGGDNSDVLAKLDTGVAPSVRVAMDTGTLNSVSAASVDTGAIVAAVWGYTLSQIVDTGAAGYKLDLLDTGVKGHVTSLSNKVDTGVPASISVDTTDTGLRQYIDRVDTGLRAAIDNVDTGQQNNYQRIVNKLDTGVAVDVWAQSGSSFTDTGSIGYRVDKLDTGTVDANIVQVNNVTVQGTGDTGTGDTWRPA